MRDSRPLGRALHSLLVGAAAAALLLTSSFRVPGHRGGGRIAEGFRPGRWDARFIVARGPAALRAPSVPVRVTAWLSGPAALRLRAPEGERAVALGVEPSPVEVALPAGGVAALEADRAVRLHEVRVARAGPPPWGRVVLAVLASLAGAALALLRRERWAVALSLALPAAVASVALRGSFGGLVLTALLDRFGPGLVLVALAASFALPGLLPASRCAAAATPRSRLPALFGGLTLVSCLAQVLLLPQPLLIGDPAAYHEIGGRFLASLAQVRGPGSLVEAMDALRPYGGLVATGLLYALLRAVRDEPSTIHAVHALAMAGAVGFLVRAALRLGGAKLGAVGGLLALLYPTFPVICGIVQPEPVILLLWTWALDRLLAARERGDLRGHGLAGVGFALGLALHPQGIWFLLLALLLLLAPFARRLAHAEAQARVGAFALGLLPVALTAAAGESFARPALHVLDERHGFWAYTARVPLGFWLFLDTDGWQGPLRIDDTRYARLLARAEEAGEARGGLGRLGFTGRFVAQNLGASVRTVLRNLHRLFHVPDNPFRRDFILPYSVQVGWHRALVVLFLLSVPLLLERRAAALLAPFLTLSATYPLYHVFNKYAVPATPFILLGAGLALSRLLEGRPMGLILALGAAGAGALLRPAELALRGVPPEVARGLLSTLHLGGLSMGFLLAARLWARDRAGRWATFAAGAFLIVPALAASWGDPSWRAFSLGLDSGLRHEIVLGAEEAARLAAAREAYLLLDLELPEGDPAGLRLEFEGGLLLPGRELQPTMPTLGLATLRGGRDPRTFRQWWRASWRAEMARDVRVVLSLRGPRSARLFGDLATPGPDGVHDGLSLGQWPHLSVYRLMHDGEYRLPVRQALSGVSRASFAGGGDLPGTLGVRLAVLDEDVGGARWETAPAPAAKVVTGIWARAGRAARADLLLPRGALLLDLERPATVAGPAGEVRVFPTGERQGWFVIRTEVEGGRPIALAVRPLQEMSPSPKFFLPELRPDAPPLPLDWAGLPYVPAVRILESREAPPWRPAAVY